MLVMDAKSLYDSLSTQQANQADARSALEAGMIKEELDKLQALPRWIPHDKNPSDAFTNKVENAHLAPLLELVRTGYWRIKKEEEELAEREHVREELGYNPRPHQQE